MIPVTELSWKDLNSEIDSMTEFKKRVGFTRIDDDNQDGTFISRSDLEKFHRLSELEKELTRRCASGNLNPSK